MGNSAWRAVVSVGISGSGSSNSPSGQKFYNLIPTTDFGIDLKHKITSSAGGRSRSNKNGERLQDFRFRDSILITADVNNVTNMILDRHKRGIPPLYLFVKIPDGAGTGTYHYKTFQNDLGQIVYHLRGYFQKRVNAVNLEGKLFKFNGLFKECWR